VTSQGIKRYENKTGLNELAVKKSRSKTVKNLKLYEPKRKKSEHKHPKWLKGIKRRTNQQGEFFTFRFWGVILG